MTESVLNPLFGSFVQLPSIPGAKSGVEEELLHLLKEIDMVFTSEQAKLLKELNDVKSICSSQKEEIHKLREVLKNHENVPEEVKQYYITDNYASKCVQLEAQIHHLTTENEQLRNHIAKYNQSPINIEKHDNMPGDIISLQEEVYALREKLRKAKLEKIFFKEQCGKLSKISSKLEEIMNEEKQKEEFLVKYPQMQEHTEDIVLSAFKKAMAKDQVDIKKFEKDLKHKIISCFQNLASSGR